MNNSVEIHERHRRSIRLRGYDYSQNGAYFVTICTHNREHLFGEIENGEMRLNDIGNIVQQCWSEIPSHYPFIVLDAFVVMPNHIHGIIVIERVPVNVRANNHSPDPVCVPASASASDPVSDGVGANNHSPVPENGEDKHGNGKEKHGIGYRANDNSPLQPQQEQTARKQLLGTSGTVGTVVRGFKIGVTKWCRMHASANMVWHRNYYEHIIRNDDEWNRIREYIEKNPEMWEEDSLFSP